eukprot:182238_1
MDEGTNMNHSDDDDIIAGVNTLGADVLCNHEDLEDEDIIAGVNTLGADALCDNRDLACVEDDQNIITGVTLGAYALCDNHDLEGVEEVIMDGNTLGEVPLTNNSNVMDVYVVHSTDQDETILL